MQPMKCSPETDTDEFQRRLARTLKQKLFAGEHVTHVKIAY